MNRLRTLWLRIRPESAGIPPHEAVRMTLGDAVAILAISWASLLGFGSTDFMMASVGASAVILFVLPTSPFAQPWPLVGGYLVSMAAGIAAASWVPFVPAAAAIAVGLAIAGMLALRCLHPPGGAVALFAVLGSDAIRASGWQLLLVPTLANALGLMLAALAINNLLPGRSYPRRPAEAAGRHPPGGRPSAALGPGEAEVAAKLKAGGRFIDVGSEELEEIVRLADRQAFRRQFGELTCAEIMRRDPVSIRADALLVDAWRQLRVLRLAVVPVVDRLGRLEGIIDLEDFLRAGRADSVRGLRGLRRRLFRLLRLNFARDSSVATLMRRDVLTATADSQAALLASPMMRGASVAVIVDDSRRIEGIVTPAELIAALYRCPLAAPDASRPRPG